MGRRYAKLLETVGNTPVVRIGRLAPPRVDLFVKIEKPSSNAERVGASAGASSWSGFRFNAL